MGQCIKYKQWLEQNRTLTYIIIVACISYSITLCLYTGPFWLKPQTSIYRKPARPLLYKCVNHGYAPHYPATGTFRTARRFSHQRLHSLYLRASSALPVGCGKFSTAPTEVYKALYRGIWGIIESTSVVGTRVGIITIPTAPRASDTTRPVHSFAS